MLTSGSRPFVRCLVFTICSLFLATSAWANNRYAALIIDADSGQVLLDRHARELRYPASLTKMMTLYMVFDALKRGQLTLKKRLRVSRDAASRPPSKLKLKAGSTITVEQAILALVTRSANDVAAVIAENLGGSESRFAQQMTRRARALGMRQTTFRNASGLPNSGQVTTAWDMATLARALLRDHPRYYRYFSTRQFSYRNRVHKSHNHLLKNYAGTDGIKTGYIRKSGFNLVASVRRNGRRIIGVVFGGKTAKQRDAHMRSLLDYGFAQLNGSGNRRYVNVNPSRHSAPRQLSPTTSSRTVQTTSRRTPITSATRPVPSSRAQIAWSDPPPPVELIGRAENNNWSTGSIGTGSANDRITSRTSGFWQVQVGVFGKMASARKHLSFVEQAAPDILFNAKATVIPLMRGGTVLYRALFQGLSEYQAGSICSALKSRRIDCLTAPQTG